MGSKVSALRRLAAAALAVALMPALAAAPVLAGGHFP